MLILTRRPGERVVIGDEILVTVMGVSGHTVRLGIAAPQGVPIYREEIWLAVKEENRAAAESMDELPSPPAAPMQRAAQESAQPPAQAAAEEPPAQTPAEEPPAQASVHAPVEEPPAPS